MDDTSAKTAPEKRDADAPSLDAQTGPTNNPRPLGDTSEHDRYPKTSPDAEGNPTNDPRPREGGSGSVPTLAKENEQSAWKEPMKQAKEAVGSRLASTKDDANETLSSARTKTADALSSFKDSASKAWEAGKSAVMNSPNSEDDENGPLVAFKKDEVDLTPEEQFTRHHVELDPSKLHHYHQQQQQQRREGEGTFEHLKTTASGAVRAARAAVLDHIPSFAHTPNNSSDTTAPPPASSSAITLESLKFKNHEHGGAAEPLHMAKVAEVRNAVNENNQIATGGGGGHGLNKLEASQTSVGGSDAVDSPNFPETLQEAITGSADSEAERKYVDDKDREKKDEDDEEEVVETGKVFGEADPFGSTVNARSKL